MNERTVFIVDDDDAVRESLALLLDSVGVASRSYADARAFLDDAKSGVSGECCLLLDIRMPGMSGLELQQELLNRGLKWPIIFISGHGDIPMAVEAMKQGAADFLQKPFRDQELLDRVNRALEAQAGALDQDAADAGTRKRLETLTPREHEVLDLMLEGKANKVMAIDLNLSQRTVEIHRARVMHKMEARSLAELVRNVIRVRDGGSS